MEEERTLSEPGHWMLDNGCCVVARGKFQNKTSEMLALWQAPELSASAWESTIMTLAQIPSLFSILFIQQNANEYCIWGIATILTNQEFKKIFLSLQ